MARGFDQEMMVVQTMKGNTSALSRYCLEDLMQCYPEGNIDEVTNHVPFVVMLLKPPEKGPLHKVFLFQKKRPGIGGALRTLRGKEYYVPTGRLRPNADHCAIKNGKMPLDQIKSKFGDKSGRFKFALDGPDNVNINCRWKSLVDRPMDAMFFGTPAGATNRTFYQLFKDKHTLPYCFRIYKQFAIETWGDPLAAGKLSSEFKAA